MIIDPPAAEIPPEDRPAGCPDAAGSPEVSHAGQPAIEPVTAALDRLREAAASHDPDGPVPC